MITFATITAQDGTMIFLEWSQLNHYVYAVYDGKVERYDKEGTFLTSGDAYEAMQKLYRAEEWNYTRYNYTSCAE